jgi:hypothetical protein
MVYSIGFPEQREKMRWNELKPGESCDWEEMDTLLRHSHQQSIPDNRFVAISLR